MPFCFNKKTHWCYAHFHTSLPLPFRTWSRPSPCYAVPWRFRAGSLWGQRSFSWIIPRRMRSWRYLLKREDEVPERFGAWPKFESKKMNLTFLLESRDIFNEDPFGYLQVQCVSAAQWSSVDIDGYVWRAFFCPQKIWGDEGAGTAEVLGRKCSYERPKKFERLHCWRWESQKNANPHFRPRTSSLETNLRETEMMALKKQDAGSLVTRISGNPPCQPCPQGLPESGAILWHGKSGRDVVGSTWCGSRWHGFLGETAMGRAILNPRWYFSRWISDMGSCFLIPNLKIPVILNFAEIRGFLILVS